MLQARAIVRYVRPFEGLDPSDGNDTRGRGSLFMLLRYFSLASALVMTLITAAVVLIHQSNQTATLLRVAEDQNAALARAAAVLCVIASVFIYVVLLLAVRRAAVTLERQFNELASFNANLEEKVAERTRDLEAANSDITNLNVELLQNIAKLREVQDEIMRKGKLAQLGQLTATVAHEIRNPLGAIRTAAYLVERKIKDKGLGLEAQMQRISNGVTRCDKIITELLDFTRSKSLALKTYPIDTWVKTTVEEETKNLPAVVQMSYDLCLGSTEASFDEDRMRRVLINLISNASEAMVGKRDDATTVAAQNPTIAVSTRHVADTIEISVADNGPGISQENMTKILQPLFTTKSFGVGLGLPAVEKILEQHGGGLRIESKPSEGATFTAWFPLGQADRKAA